MGNIVGMDAVTERIYGGEQWVSNIMLIPSHDRLVAVSFGPIV